MIHMKLRKELQWFAEEMEAKLRENDHKSGWHGNTVRSLFQRLREESDELLVQSHPLQLDTIAETLSREDACELIRECADIANFAMMIADNIRLKHEGKNPDTSPGDDAIVS